jgi:hypothetical protein
MAQPTQVIFTDPNNDFNAVDNSAASTTTTLAGALNPSPIGFDTPANNATQFAGAVDQGLNPFGATGTVLVDTVNPQTRPFYKASTVVGNPVSNVATTANSITTVLNTVSGQRLIFLNPA